MSRIGRIPESAVEPVARAATTDPRVLRSAVVAAVLGFGLQLVASAQHPTRVDPNDSAAVFVEYAASSAWTLIHLGQFVGGLLVAVSLVQIGRSLPRDGIAGALASIGSIAAIVWASIFGVQMAVDGVALKATIDAWLAAPAGSADAAFLVAEGVRSIEKGLSALFILTNGVTLLALGLAVAAGRTYAPWLGWFGTAAGLGFIAGGVTTAHTGFSAEAASVIGSAQVPALVFLFGTAVAMWRAAGHSGDRSAVPVRHPAGQPA
jgi:hypothetical protein